MPKTARFVNRQAHIMPLLALVIYPFVVQFVRDTGITGGDEAKTGFYAGLLVSAFLSLVIDP